MNIRQETRIFEPPFVAQKYVQSMEDLASIRKGYELLGKKVVLTQGVWDLLHRGHLRYLYAAAQMGDVLIVGVDSDALTRKRKGEGRPAVPQDERIEMLAFEHFINHIVLRDVQQDIGTLIKTVRPDVLIVSETTKDFPKEDVEVYTECCGQIVRLAEQARTSSTERLRQQVIQGKLEVVNLLENLIKKVRGS